MTYCIKPASDFWDSAKDRYYKRGATNIGTPFVWPKFKFKIRPQELTIWSGYAGHGKSAFLSMMALQLATHGERTVIGSFEMPADQTVARLLKQALGKSDATEAEIDQCKEFIGQHIYIFDYVGRVTNQKDMLEQFKMASEADGITQFQVDSLLKCGMNEDDYNGQKRFVEDLHNFAMSRYAHVHLVAHSRKGEDENKVPGKMDVAHSGSISQLCNNGITVWRNKRKEEEMAANQFARMSEYDSIIWCWKSRECGPDEEGKVGLYYNHSAIQYLQNQNDPTYRFKSCLDLPL
jgi:twinkle protein